MWNSSSTRPSVPRRTRRNSRRLSAFRPRPPGGSYFTVGSTGTGPLAASAAGTAAPARQGHEAETGLPGRPMKCAPRPQCRKSASWASWRFATSPGGPSARRRALMWSSAHLSTPPLVGSGRGRQLAGSVANAWPQRERHDARRRVTRSERRCSRAPPNRLPQMAPGRNTAGRHWFGQQFIAGGRSSTRGGGNRQAVQAAAGGQAQFAAGDRRAPARSTTAHDVPPARRIHCPAGTALMRPRPMRASHVGITGIRPGAAPGAGEDAGAAGRQRLSDRARSNALDRRQHAQQQSSRRSAPHSRP